LKPLFPLPLDLLFDEPFLILHILTSWKILGRVFARGHVGEYLVGSGFDCSVCVAGVER